MKLRPHQKEAPDSWLNAERRGVVQLSTSGGKTYIALKTIKRNGVPGNSLLGDALVSQLALEEVEARLDERMNSSDFSLQEVTELMKALDGARHNLRQGRGAQTAGQHLISKPMSARVGAGSKSAVLSFESRIR